MPTATMLRATAGNSREFGTRFPPWLNPHLKADRTVFSRAPLRFKQRLNPRRSITLKLLLRATPNTGGGGGLVSRRSSVSLHLKYFRILSTVRHWGCTVWQVASFDHRRQDCAHRGHTICTALHTTSQPLQAGCFESWQL